MCPGCKAYKNEKYKAEHTDECKRRFETLLVESVKGKRRFEAATKRRLNAITRKAAEMQEAAMKVAEAPTEASMAVAGSGAAASGSGLEPHRQNGSRHQ